MDDRDRLEDLRAQAPKIAQLANEYHKDLSAGNRLSDEQINLMVREMINAYTGRLLNLLFS